jgi:hypothetical protein
LDENNGGLDEAAIIAYAMECVMLFAEKEFDHVTILHLVFLAFRTQRACRP